MLVAALTAALPVFLLRVLDVSIGTIRMLYSVRGRRLTAASLALIESGIFITAISRVLVGVPNPWKMVGYACGFSAGTALGITLEKWIGSGTILARIITRSVLEPLADLLRGRGFGVTVVHGAGREGDVHILFVVAPRRRSKELMAAVADADPHAFVTVDPVDDAVGGYVTSPRSPVSVRK